ncbi:unnamed protein product [Rotaria socialis]|uniref:DNA ligase 3 n=1 Tax=Rotaria socialis TaxID=392032 RepID=A0A820ITW0_9BILA|nr:unnamed protein product [Rotaria socialis]CAF3653490.1 unnamed protein product [Rotaria socialis]CAF4316920.1 unnamed protein product [Rotaria socialis]CAF4537681.1 unnamed protein product [Rotaria socialis]
MTENRFSVDYAKLGTSACKKCKTKIAKGEIRIAKVTPSPFSEGDTMKIYHHVACIFDTFLNARATTKIIESSTDLDGWLNIMPVEREIILEQIKRVQEARANKVTTKSPVKKATKSTPVERPKQTIVTPTKKISPPLSTPIIKIADDGDDESTIDNDDIKILDKKTSKEETTDGIHIPLNDDPKHPDNSFRQFRGLCTKIAETNGHLAKTSLVQDFITYGIDGESYQGNLSLLFHLLLPSKGYKSIIYNLKSKQLCKLFSIIFHENVNTMIQKCEESGDVAETISDFYSSSTHVKPPPKTLLSNYDVDKFLHELGQLTREQDQIPLLRKITEKSTVNDLRMFIRLIQKDLKINAGPKHIIESLGANAYESFQATNDLKSFIKRYLEHKSSVDNGSQINKQLSIKIELMTPVHPMLAEPCKSVDFAFKRCPNGFYAEIKYDGERLQLHKDRTNKFKFFSRSLKSVTEHKIDQISQYISKAFPKGESMILDGEILLVDRKTKKPLPFGTLGVHKKKEFSEANEAFFIFDCLYYNGESLLHKTLKERRQILTEHMVSIENRILLSDLKTVNKKSELKHLINFTIAEGLEGLVLKNPDGMYEPNKRHWLKVKKDYLMDGTMADTADLVVLGAYYGTGKKGGLMSVFLLGCYDPKTDQWCTVAKCGNGFDDATLEKLQADLKFNMNKISKNPNQVPRWLNISRDLIPDFIVVDPKQSPVWEITGAEFSKSKQHTANGISIRFPRVTKVRDDKTWREATNLSYLAELFEKSKPTKRDNDDDDDEENLFHFGDTNDNNNNNSPQKSTPTKRKLLEIDSDDDIEIQAKPPKIIRKSLPNSLLKVHFPNIFDNKYIYLSSSLPMDEYNNLKRHIEAFGGKVLSPRDINNDKQLARVTHCVGVRDATFDKIDAAKKTIETNVTHISLPTVYVWKCIATKTKL